MTNALGAPRNRADGPAKVTGQADYTADKILDRVSYGVFVTSTIPSGTVTGIDISDAEAAPGVLKIFTRKDFPNLKSVSHPPAGQSQLPLRDDVIRYEGQPVALVVAETLEQAQHASRLVRPSYSQSQGETNYRARLSETVAGVAHDELDAKVGDFESAIQNAAIKIEQSYETADRHHNPMEPSATIAEWRNGRLTLFDATQWVWGVRLVVSAALGIRPEDIHVTSSYLGGGFGCKGYVWPHQIITAAAARELDRPLKVVLPRAQDYTSHGYQPATLQRLILGANTDGRLLAIKHESVNTSGASDPYTELTGAATRTLYACPSITTVHRAVQVNRGNPTPMRAPHEGPGMFALESAIDELAVALRVDPIELRLKNYAERDPLKNKPFSSKGLKQCYLEGAERFGWKRRSPEAQSMKEGRDLIGWGMASAIMTTFRFPANCRVTLERAGTVLIEAGTQEIGTGVRTVIPQIAAEVLGIPADLIHLRLGDTSLPETGGTFGSSTTIGVGSAVYDGASKLKRSVLDLNGGIMPVSQREISEFLSQRGLDRVSADGSWSPGPNANGLGEVPDWSMDTFGAVFTEVRIDQELPVPRVTRCLGIYSAGRIVNPKTARSQMIGGMVWGIGQALLEHSAMDHSLGRYLSKNLSGYLVPVNADVPALEAYFVDEVDQQASAFGGKGIGELGAVGVAPAIVNAIYHATGKRIRQVPVLPEMLL